ncbi:MAG: peptide chain release factor N(5)-glutamine methyltransferase [Holosporales bacterium]|nr:peptide chain release factor N(5)-glutamine methyltransferase [Holosporales bacterium]
MKLNIKKTASLFSKKYKVREKDILILLARILNSSYSNLFFEEETEASYSDVAKLEEYLTRLGKQEPISKIIQQKEFYGIPFKTNEHTLDPRPETELIIDLFRKYYKDQNAVLRTLDLGSGTGCIGLTILSLYKNSLCNFADADEAAINVTIENAAALGLSNRCEFTISDWFSNVSGQYDVIVSNPPYIADGYKLDKTVLFDPPAALFAGTDGLDSYKAILPQIRSFLKPYGKLILEIGYDQKDKILEIACNLKLLEIAKDLRGISRALVFECDLH